MEKPKTSTIDALSDTDRVMVNRLLVLIKDMYIKVRSPPKYGPHHNPQEAEDSKSSVLNMSLKVGERLVFPRGLTGHLYQPRIKRGNKK